jgi:hypothetical protein
MPVERKPEARQQVIDALAPVLTVNPDLVAGVVLFVGMIDGSVLVLHTVCCLTHASLVCDEGLNQAAEVTGWGCPRRP